MTLPLVPWWVKLIELAVYLGKYLMARAEAVNAKRKALDARREEAREQRRMVKEALKHARDKALAGDDQGAAIDIGKAGPSGGA